MITIFAPSVLRGPIFIILVYPPCLSKYLGAISSTNFLTTDGVMAAANNLRFAKELTLARVINFSATTLNSFAFASVVFILPCKKRLAVNKCNRALRWFLGRDNILPLFR